MCSLLYAACILALSLAGCSKNLGTNRLSEPIKSELESEVAKMACIKTESFPFVSDSYKRQSCLDCEKFVVAGLLTKKIESDGSAGEGVPTSITYDLTDTGESAYVPSSTGEIAYGASSFCFGKPRILKITRLFGPVAIGTRNNLGIRFVVQLDDPNPFIFDPRARNLGIPLPDAMMPGKPVLYPEQDVTAVINAYNQNDFYLDASMHVGPAGEN